MCGHSLLVNAGVDDGGRLEITELIEVKCFKVKTIVGILRKELWTILLQKFFVAKCT